MFPVSATGTILIDRKYAGAGVVLGELERTISRQGPSVVRTEGNVIFFKAKGSRARPTSLMGWNGRGTVEVTEYGDDVMVSFKLSFVAIPLVATVLAIVFGRAILVNAERQGASPLASFSILAAAWLVLVGTNYLLGVTQFKAILQLLVDGTRVLGKASAR